MLRETGIAATAGPRSRMGSSRLSPTDVVAALALSVAGVGTLLAQPLAPAEGVTRTADAAGVLLSVGMTLPVAWRRASPRAVMVLSGLCALIASTSGYGVTVGALTTWILLGSTALHTDRRNARALLVLGAVAVAGSVASLAAANRTAIALLSAAAVGTLPPLVGDALRRQRELTDQVRRLQAAAVEQATAAERVRIARDVHDTVGHHLSAISLQARAGHLEAQTGDNAAASQTLDAIARLSDRALHDTGHILGLLRGGEAESSAPTPGLDRLDELVQSARLAGVHVHLERRGQLDDLAGALQSCAYRIAQEALTNAARHAAASEAAVCVARTPGRVELTISDNGRAARAGSPPAEGRGLTGMRERALALGGSVTAGPSPAGSWVVHAVLPDRA